ncbi:MAG: hypothetical protein ACYC5A_02490 [Thermoleophilia bacterium]
MDDTRNINGEEPEEKFDLSAPQQGEPTLDQSVDGGAGGEPEWSDEPEPPFFESEPEPGAASREPEGEAPEPEIQPEPGLPLPLLHELEGEPPVKEPEVAAPPPAAEAVVEEPGGKRRLSEQWRIDLKWIFGLPATVILILTLAALVLFRVSGEQVAEGLIEDTRVKIVSDSRFRRELSQVDPTLLTLLDSKELDRSLYEDPEMFQSLVDAIPRPEEGDPRADQVEYIRSSLDIYSSLAGVIGKSQHVQARSALIGLLMLLVLFGVPYLIFSRRLGKIVSTAISLGLASWLPLLGLMFLRGNLSDWISDRPGITQDYQTSFVLGMVDSFANGLVDAAMPTYRFFSLVALILLGFGALGLLLVWWRFSESTAPRKKKLRD